jgi:hypothetical protein
MMFTKKLLNPFLATPGWGFICDDGSQGEGITIPIFEIGTAASLLLAELVGQTPRPEIRVNITSNGRLFLI